MDKLDYKKAYKELYLPKQKPTIITVPAIPFVMIAGQGDPNSEEFALVTAALYSFSYGVKMSYKDTDVPAGYYHYIVFPLEGVWDLVDHTKSATEKSNFKYNIMIRQPDFLTEELFLQILAKMKKKKPNCYFDQMGFSTISEGLCCQMLHIGSYDEEPISFETMQQFCSENGFERNSHAHREIYLSDPRKIASDKLKTVLRYRIKNSNLP